MAVKHCSVIWQADGAKVSIQPVLLEQPRSIKLSGYEKKKKPTPCPRQLPTTLCISLFFCSLRALAQQLSNKCHRPVIVPLKVTVWYCRVGGTVSVKWSDTVCLSTQVYKWVLAKLMLNVTQWWTRIPSTVRNRNTHSRFMPQKPV